MLWYKGSLRTSDSILLSSTDPVLTYGASVFTTIRIYQASLDHPLTRWVKHCQRLSSSVKDFDWKIPDWQQVEQGARAMGEKYLVLRISLSPDGSELITGRGLPNDLEVLQKIGAKGWVTNSPLFTRTIPEYKTGNYLPNWLALQFVQKHGYREAILLDAKGKWLESSTGNLWGFKNGCWYTPPLEDGILPGIARGYLLELLGKHQIPYEEKSWNFDFVKELEVIAYSNSVVEIVPFQSITLEKEILHFNVKHESYRLLKQFYLES